MAFTQRLRLGAVNGRQLAKTSQLKIEKPFLNKVI
jgi:hypothetical protein